MPRPTRDEPDYRLRIFKWSIISHEDPTLEYYGPTEWDKAIDRARELAQSTEVHSRIQVIDAWGMLIAQFCPYSIFMPPELFAIYHA